MARRIALVFGIGNYKEYPQLKHVHSSVKDVFRLLTSEDYGQCAPSPASKLVTDEQGSITTKLIFSEIEDILSSLETADQFVFYFSGHADLLASKEDDLFLIASDTRKDKQEEGFAFSTLLARLGNRNLNASLLVVDACHSQAMFGAIKSWGSTKLPKRMGLMSSAEYFRQAEEDPLEKRTRFSRYFCEGIRCGCDGIPTTDSDKITMDTLSRYINTKIELTYGEKAQTSDILLIGPPDELWLAKRHPKSGQGGNGQYADQPFISLAVLIKIFERDYVTQAECDMAGSYLERLPLTLRYSLHTLPLKYPLEKKIEKLVEEIKKFRPVCRSRSSDAQKKQKWIKDELETVLRKLRKL